MSVVSPRERRAVRDAFVRLSGVGYVGLRGERKEGRKVAE